MMTLLKEICIDTWKFLKNFWWSVEDFFEFKVWPHRLEWAIFLTACLSAANILLLFYLSYTIPYECFVQ